jgi:precorrin-2 dehydrogenase/sirohydrochlorin ferrochelatase
VNVENSTKSYHFPVNLDVRHRKCLVVGGGKVAERKVESLLHCGAKVCIVSPDLTDGLRNLADRGIINFMKRRYVTEDLEGCFLVISAVDDSETNSKIADDCLERNILVNVVDDPARCSFTVPSVLHRGPLCVAVSTQGKSPLLAKKIREQLEDLFGPEYSEFVELMGKIRQQVMENVPDREKRRRIFECLIDSNILELIREGKRESIKEQIDRCMSLWQNPLSAG